MRRTGALACAAVLAAGCAQLPRETRTPVSIEEVRPVLERLDRQADARVSLRAVGRLRMVTPEGDGRVREIILAQRPDRLRLESHGPLGQAVGLLVTGDGRYGFFDGERLESGAVRDDLLVRRLGLELRPAEAVELLLAAPAIPGDARAAFRRDADTVVDGDGWRLVYDALGDLAQVETLDASGDVRWRARYDGWRDEPGGRFPRELALEFPATRVRAELVLSRVELNPELAPAQFLPPGSRP